uniref:Muscle M-line assembly protein unc-89 n=1 Tax=Lygus hesperus TaxID=30085 RepID=A0A0A9YR58_LYGHE
MGPLLVEISGMAIFLLPVALTTERTSNKKTLIPVLMAPVETDLTADSAASTALFVMLTAKFAVFLARLTGALTTLEAVLVTRFVVSDTAEVTLLKNPAEHVPKHTVTTIKPNNFMSTAQPTATDIQSTPIIIKEEYIEKSSPGISDTVESEQILSHPSQQVHQQNLLKPIRPKKEPDTSPPKAKESLVKRTLGKPGSIGSMTVSPKKILPEIEDPDSDVVTISGEDGMIYKVSKSELNNSLLMAGEDGQQCVYLTTGENGDENATVITLDPSSYTEQVNQLGQQVNVLNEVGEEGQQFYVKEGEEGELMDIQVQEGAEDGQSQLVAQLVEAGEPAPGGGPRRVVLLLPDGNLMMTEVDEEQYAALELDKFQGQTAEIE